MKYREFLDLTDDEIKYILTEIFHPVSIGEIRRDFTWNEIVVERQPAAGTTATEKTSISKMRLL